MAAPIQTMTVADFIAWSQRPENYGRDYEFIAGEIVDVVSSPKSTRLGARMLRYISAFVDDNNLGEVSGADGGYIVGEGRYMPDVGFIAAGNLPVTESVDGYVPAPPDLAVEVVSPTDSERLLMIKVADYLAAGTVVWVIYPDMQQLIVYEAGKPARTMQAHDKLKGDPVLPGFALDLKNVFK